jgi:outer membrane lipoprotein
VGINDETESQNSRDWRLEVKQDMNRRILLLLFILVVSTLLGACSSTIPQAIRTPVDSDIRVDEVQQTSEQFKESRVRWGGEIISVENLADETHIEILAQRLDKSGKPISSRRSQGRFIARIAGFLEPQDFPKDQRITVVGQIEDVIEKPVGNYPYTYPRVLVESYYLWPEQSATPQPYFYDPYYDPMLFPYWRRYPYYY